MLDRYVLTGFFHLLGTALVLKILLFILPLKVTSCFMCASELVIIVIVGKITYGFTKKYFLSEAIERLDSKAVLVTGCDHGFGHDIAKRMHKKGFHVFACCLNGKGEGAEKLRKGHPDRMTILNMDVTKDEDMEKSLEIVKEYIKKHNVQLWGVVNNAGIFKGFSVELTKLEDFKSDMEVNAFGMVRVAKTFLPLIRRSKGRVVNVTSLAGKVAMGNIAPYTMSKFAAVAFTECLRQEMIVWGVKVISIEPEFFRTPMGDRTRTREEIDRAFNSAKDEIKKEYSEQYLKSLKSYLLMKSNSLKIYKVIDAIEEAICLKYPDTWYFPCRNYGVYAFLSIWKITPKVFQDFVASIYRRFKMELPPTEYTECES